MIRLFLIFVLVLPSAIKAQDSYGSVGFFKGWQLEDGSYQSAIVFDLKPGWKTYWRIPGPAGIPPEFLWTGSENIEGIAMSWPTPEVFESFGTLSIGYTDKLVLPVRIKPKDINTNININLTINFGVCSDICAPASAILQGSFGANTPDDGIAEIKAALAKGAISANSGGLQDVSCTISPNQNGMNIDTQLKFSQPQNRDKTIIIEYPDPNVWIEVISANTNGNSVSGNTVLQYYGDGVFAVDRSKLSITVLGGTHAIELTGCPAS